MPSTDKINTGIAGFIFIILLSAIFSYMIMAPTWHDENMYISAGVLIQDHSLYKDFAFLQMPYLPLIYGLIFKVTATTHYLLWSELINFLLMALTAGLIYVIVYQISKDIIVSMGILLLFLLNNIIIYTIGYSANTIMPLLWSLLGYYVFIKSVTGERINRLGVLVAGICLAIAAGTKLYYASLIPPFLITALFFPTASTFKQRFAKIILPMSAGVFIGLLPALYYFIKDPAVFLFNNFSYHKINTMYRAMQGYNRGMSALSKMLFWRQTFEDPSNIVLFVGTFFLFFNLTQRHGNAERNWKHVFHPESVLLLLIIFFSTVAAFAPTPLWKHYFVIPIPFMIILLVYWYGQLSTAYKNVFHILLVCFILLSFIYNGEKLFGYINQIHVIGKWESLAIHKTAIQIRKYIETDSTNPKIATLSPLYALEAGCSVYNEFSTGLFIYRLSDTLLQDEIMPHIKYTTPQQIDQLFEHDPPDAILIDLKSRYDLDEPFYKYALNNNFVRVDEDFNGMTLYVRHDISD